MLTTLLILASMLCIVLGAGVLQAKKKISPDYFIDEKDYLVTMAIVCLLAPITVGVFIASRFMSVTPALNLLVLIKLRIFELVSLK